MKKLRSFLSNVLKNKYGALIDSFGCSKLEALSLVLFTSLSFFNKRRLPTLNFLIITSAELRVFTPIINYLTGSNQKLIVNVFNNSSINFDEKTLVKIRNSKNIKVRKSGFELCKTYSSIKSVNIICIDHLQYEKEHATGIKLMSFIRKNAGKTVCIQHGGSQIDNINGQATSISEFQILYGEFIYNYLMNLGIDASKTYLTGNPLHDRIYNKRFKTIPSNRHVISLITCVHTEYSSYENSLELYNNYLRNIYNSIDFEKYILVVKMHPNDSIAENLYLKVKEELSIGINDILIVGNSSTIYDVYDIINSSKVVISRASTVIEEALMLGKKVIAYDLFEDGPSKYYDHLLVNNMYEKIIEDSERLKRVLSEDNYNQVYTTENNKFVNSLTYKLDGNSCKRVVESLINIIEN